MESFEVDARNIPRGRCKDPGCHCRGYKGASSVGKKCACSHPPGKHVNLSLPVCEECGLNRPPDFNYCTPTCRNKALERGEFGTIDISDLEKSLEPVKINRCQAKDCSNFVFWDYRMEFSYCSPKCRDNHLLEKNQELLQREIKKMEDEIVVIMKKQQHKTYPRIESPVDKPQLEKNKIKNSGGAAATNSSQEQIKNSGGAAATTSSQEQIKNSGGAAATTSSQEHIKNSGGAAATTSSQEQIKNSGGAAVTTSSQEQMHCFGNGSHVVGTIDRHPCQTTAGREQLDQDGRRGASLASLSPRKGQKGRIREVEFLKDMRMDHGIIVCDVLWPTSEIDSHQHTQGFLITGMKVDKHLMGFKKMQDCQLRIFDIIVTVNGKLVKDCCGNSPQEILDDLLHEKDFVRLRIYSPFYSLKTTHDIIKMIKGQRVIPSHIIAVVYPVYYPEGLSFQINSELELSSEKVLIVRSTEEVKASAELCGLKNGDKYVYSVKGLEGTHDVNSLCSSDHKLKKIRQQFKDAADLVLAIVR